MTIPKASRPVVVAASPGGHLTSHNNSKASDIMDGFSICVTVGTLDLQLRFLAAAALDGCSGLIQLGGSDAALAKRIPGNFRAQDYKKLEQAMATSNVVVAHAGIGPIIKANSLRRPLVLLPRLEKYREHFDDHQLQISNVIQNIPGISVSEDSGGDFRQKIQKTLTEPPIVGSALGGDELPTYLKSWVERIQSPS